VPSASCLARAKALRLDPGQVLTLKLESDSFAKSDLAADLIQFVVGAAEQRRCFRRNESWIRTRAGHDKLSGLTKTDNLST